MSPFLQVSLARAREVAGVYLASPWTGALISQVRFGAGAVNSEIRPWAEDGILHTRLCFVHRFYLARPWTGADVVLARSWDEAVIFQTRPRAEYVIFLARPCADTEFLVSLKGPWALISLARPMDEAAFSLQVFSSSWAVFSLNRTVLFLPRLRDETVFHQTRP